jgi:hypothetical protein
MLAAPSICIFLTRLYKKEYTKAIEAEKTTSTNQVLSISLLSPTPPQLKLKENLVNSNTSYDCLIKVLLHTDISILPYFGNYTIDVF